MADPTNPYTTTSVSGFNASAPPNDGTRTSDNKLDWDKHVDKIGTPLKNAVESIDTNVSSAFGDLIMTDDPGQETVVEAMKMFAARAEDPRRKYYNIDAAVALNFPESENYVVGTAFFSG